MSLHEGVADYSWSALIKKKDELMVQNDSRKITRPAGIEKTSENESVYQERIRIALAVYRQIILPDYFLPYTCAGTSAVLQGVMRHFGHHIGRTGVTPVEDGPCGEQVHVVAYDDAYVYDLTYTQFRRLKSFGTPIIRREDFETRFLLLPSLFDPLMCEPDFYKHYIHMLGNFHPKRSEDEDSTFRTFEKRD